MKFVVEKAIGAKLTDEQFRRALNIQNAQSFSAAFSDVIGLLKDVHENSPENYGKILTFASKHTGIEPEGLQKIISSPATEGAAFIVNEALKRADLLVPASESKKKTIEPFNASLGSQGKFGKAFVALVDVLVNSEIDFHKIYTMAKNKENFELPSENYSYETAQNETKKAIQDTIKECGLVKVKSKGLGLFGKTYYASINDMAIPSLHDVLVGEDGKGGKLSEIKQKIHDAEQPQQTTSQQTFEEGLKDQLDAMKSNGLPTPFTDTHAKSKEKKGKGGSPSTPFA